MGVTISFELLQKQKHVKKMLDKAEKFAELLNENQLSKIGISMTIRRITQSQLLIDIGGCETLAFDFDKTEQIADWQKEYAILLKYAEQKNEALATHAERMKTHSVVIDVEGNTLLMARAFCKTQYGKDVEHKIVCDILKFVQSQCLGSIVNDESDFFYSEKIADATEAKESNAQVLAIVVEKLTGTKPKKKGK